MVYTVSRGLVSNTSAFQKLLNQDFLNGEKQPTDFVR